MWSESILAQVRRASKDIPSNMETKKPNLTMSWAQENVIRAGFSSIHYVQLFWSGYDFDHWQYLYRAWHKNVTIP
jgi:hypothetical protein